MMKKRVLFILTSFALVITLVSFVYNRNVLLEINGYSSKGLCVSYSGIPPKKNGMVWVEGGEFKMSNNQGYVDKDSGKFEAFPEEAGEHIVTLDGFWIDPHEVTNAQFTRFVKETDYVTIAEKPPKKEWLPVGFPEDQLIAGSAVFIKPDKVEDRKNINQWWKYVHGADWRQPEGPGSDIIDKENHPVVHIAYEDAKAYAKWVGRELPTEAQWEYAAKTEEIRKTPDEKWIANTWQGEFPKENSAKDGYIGTAPVGCYPANDNGLFDMTGNVWEIVHDNYISGHKGKSNTNPKGPTRSYDPGEPGTKKHVIKGGSYLCTPHFCMRYRPTARQPHDFLICVTYSSKDI